MQYNRSCDIGSVTFGCPPHDCSPERADTDGWDDRVHVLADLVWVGECGPKMGWTHGSRPKPNNHNHFRRSRGFKIGSQYRLSAKSLLHVKRNMKAEYGVVLTEEIRVPWVSAMLHSSDTFYCTQLLYYISNAQVHTPPCTCVQSMQQRTLQNSNFRAMYRSVNQVAFPTPQLPPNTP